MKKRCEKKLLVQDCQLACLFLKFQKTRNKNLPKIKKIRGIIVSSTLYGSLLAMLGMDKNRSQDYLSGSATQRVESSSFPVSVERTSHVAITRVSEPRSH